MRRRRSVWIESLEKRQLLSGEGSEEILGNILVNDPATDTGIHDTQADARVLVIGSTVLVGYTDSQLIGTTASPTLTGFSRSTDGGASFSDQGASLNHPDGDAGELSLARDTSSGRIYALAPSADLSKMYVYRSDDTGMTFLPPVHATSFLGSVPLSAQSIAVDNGAGTGNGHVYVAAINAASNQIVLSRSTDGGDSYAAAGAGFTVAGLSAAWVAVALGTDHSVYVFYYDSAIRLRRSTDFGATFAPAVTVASPAVPILEFATHAPPNVVVNPANGQLYLVYHTDPAGTDRSDIFFTMSADSGTSWSPMQRINDDSSVNDQFSPTIAVQPDGSKVFIGWYDRRVDPANRMIATYGAIGTVSGGTVTFGPNFRVSSEFFPPLFNAEPSINPTFMGANDTAAADNEAFYFAWTDNRDNSASRDGKQANIRLSRIPELGPSPNGASVFTSTPNKTVYVDPPPHVDIVFDSVMDPASFAAGLDVFSFTGPGGSDLRSRITGHTWINASTLRIHFSLPKIDGTYSLVIGPEIYTAEGLAMDHDRDGIAGEVVQDRFVASFSYALHAGADGFGYTAKPIAPNFTDLTAAGAGVVTLLNGTDDGSASIPLGSNTFNFYGVTYSGSNQLHVSANGLITFGTAPGSSVVNSQLLGTMAPTIAALWDDWQTNVGAGPSDSAVLYKLDAVNNLLIIEWNDVPHFNNIGAATFQAVLQLNTGATPGTIRLEYNLVTVGNAALDNGASATVGIRDGGAAGPRRLLAHFDQASSFVGNGKAVLISTTDMRPPVVVSSRFDFDSPQHRLVVTFNEPIAPAPDVTDLVIENLTTATSIDPASLDIDYDTLTFTATVTFPGLPNGRVPDATNLRATLASATLLDTAGLPLDGDANGVAGANHVHDFFHLAGDANHDRKVDLQDLVILAANWQGTGKLFSQGDFDYNGVVNAMDLGILAQRWQQPLAIAAPPLAAFPTSVRPPARTPTRSPTRVIDLI